jgi:hypothetical protein
VHWPEHNDQLPARRRDNWPWHHDQVPATHSDRRRWKGLGTTANYLQCTTSDTPGIGLDATIKYL